MKVTITPEMLRRWAEKGEDETSVAGQLSPADHPLPSILIEEQDLTASRKRKVKAGSPSVSFLTGKRSR